MSQAKDRRHRAVRLTDPGLEILKARLAEEWERKGDGKITRASRAELLAVSVGTADRILSQGGNDRAVLVLVFARLGIPWEDRYCELRQVETEDEPEDALEQEPAPSPRRRRLMLVLAAAIAAGILGLLLIVAPKSQPPLLEDPHGPVSQTLDVSRKAYHDADYDTAIRKVREAFRMAQHHALADQMAFCMSLEGDILAAKGDLEGAVESYTRATHFWGSLENAHGLASAIETLAVAEAKLGLLDQAEQHFQEALKICKSVKDPGVIGGILRGLGSTEAVRGNLASARKWYAAANLAIKEPGQEPMQLDLKALGALVLRDEGKSEEALKELQECLSAWKADGQPRWIAATLLQIGSVHSKMGNEVLARQQISEARQLYESVGDRRGSALCAQWLGSKVSAEAWRSEEYF